MINKTLKILVFLSMFLLTTGFVPIFSLLGPGMTILSSGNLYKAGAQYIIDQSVKKKTGKESAKIIDEISNASKAGKTKPTRVQRNARFRIAFLVLLTLPIIGAVIFLTLRQSELEKILKEVLSNNKELTINIQNRDAQYQKLELELGGFRAQRGAPRAVVRCGRRRGPLHVRPDGQRQDLHDARHRGGCGGAALRRVSIELSHGRHDDARWL